MVGATNHRNAMSVTPRLGQPKVRRVNTLVNRLLPGDYGVHDNCIQNTTRAILERVFFVKTDRGFELPPKPRPSHYYDTLGNFYHKIKVHVRPATPLTYDQFVSLYDGRKRTIYQNAVDQLLTAGLDRRDAHVTSFVKAEKLDLREKPDPAPRIIQPRHPKYNTEIGVYTRSIEHMIFKSIGKIFGSPTVMKGYDATQVANIMRDKWDSFLHPVAIGLDASRFDQHVSVPALKWEHQVYKLWYPHEKHFSELLSWQLNNVGRAYCEDGVIKYKVEGCRMSGDMTTGLGNCLTMCALVWSYFEDKCKIHLVNNGDDCVVIMEQKHLKHLEELPKWFTLMGFTMKVEPPVVEFEQIKFCQMSPVFDGATWLMVRDPRTALSKDLITLKPIMNVNSWKFQCQAISDGGKALYGHMPVFCSFYKMLDVGYNHPKNLSQHLTGGLKFWQLKKAKTFAEPTDEARASFYYAFDITPDEQRSLESYYSKVVLTHQPTTVRKFTESLLII